MKRSTRDFLEGLLFLGAIAGLIALTSCTVTYDPNTGSKSVSVDPGAAVAIGKIIAEK